MSGRLEHDARESRERVRLARESPPDYDAEFYADPLVRAAESVCAPLGWRRGDIEDYLAERTDAPLSISSWRYRAASRATR